MGRIPQCCANITGFNNRMAGMVASIQPGDILLCYMTRVMRWVGALEVLGPSDDNRVIWSLLLISCTNYSQAADNA